MVAGEEHGMLPLRLTQAQRRAVAGLLPELCPNLLLDSPNQRTLQLLLDQIESIARACRAAIADVENGMVRNSLRHVIESAEASIEKCEDEDGEADEYAEPASLPDFLMRVSREDDDEEPVILPIQPIKRKAKLGVKLTELQRDAVIHATRLRRGLKRHLAEAGAGIQYIEFTRKEFDELQSEVGEAAYYASSPYKRRLQSIINKLSDAREADILERYGVQKGSSRASKPAKAAIYQLKISLQGIKPQIWRRVQVKDCTLTRLHQIIQATMGWQDYHMWFFQVAGDRYTHPQMIGDMDWKNAQEVTLSQVINSGHKKFGYIYDMGDEWHHSITVEKTLGPESKTKYPRFVAGAQACPPEDCGGIWGYEHFLEVVQDPKHEEHDDMLEWVGGNFDPDEFDGMVVTKRMSGSRP